MSTIVFSNQSSILFTIFAVGLDQVWQTLKEQTTSIPRIKNNGSKNGKNKNDTSVQQFRMSRFSHSEETQQNKQIHGRHRTGHQRFQ